MAAAQAWPAVPENVTALIRQMPALQAMAALSDDQTIDVSLAATVGGVPTVYWGKDCRCPPCDSSRSPATNFSSS